MRTRLIHPPATASSALSQSLKPPPQRPKLPPLFLDVWTTDDLMFTTKGRRNHWHDKSRDQKLEIIDRHPFSILLLPSQTRYLWQILFTFDKSRNSKYSSYQYHRDISVIYQRQRSFLRRVYQPTAGSSTVEDASTAKAVDYVSDVDGSHHLPLSVWVTWGVASWIGDF